VARLKLVEYVPTCGDESDAAHHLVGSGYCEFETLCGYVNTQASMRHFYGSTLTCRACLIAARDTLDALGMRHPVWMNAALAALGATR